MIYYYRITVELNYNITATGQDRTGQLKRSGTTHRLGQAKDGMGTVIVLLEKSVPFFLCCYSLSTPTKESTREKENHLQIYYQIRCVHSFMSPGLAQAVMMSPFSLVLIPYPLSTDDDQSQLCPFHCLFRHHLPSVHLPRLFTWVSGPGRKWMM